jgi:hypothetical protein
MDTLDADDLETILIIARNGQSGRITEREIKLRVEAYREWHGIPATPRAVDHRDNPLSEILAEALARAKS